MADTTRRVEIGLTDGRSLVRHMHHAGAGALVSDVETGTTRTITITWTGAEVLVIPRAAIAYVSTRPTEGAPT
jgi:hypothetical protein